MKKRQMLPIGDASFESIRKNNKLYVDKTRQIFRMADEGSYYFFARPRRFGKSLTVSTLQSLFQGRKELFEGLWISEHGEWEWKKHPVVTIDFNLIPRSSADVLKRSIAINMDQTAIQYGIELHTEFIETRLQELITGLYDKFKTEVAVLIDEYDKPVIDHIGGGAESIKIAKENRDVLKSFFGVLKGAQVTPCLRFVFLTGVSKFSRVSIFSELNNLIDISMNRNYADMNGYTQAELESCFASYINAFADETGSTIDIVKEKLKTHYNGYRFSEKEIYVYNPFSILNTFNEIAYKNYWFETGTPTFLINLLNTKGWYLPAIEGLQVSETAFSTYDLERLKPEALLFQTGYVTIKDVANRIYTFGYPNQEVKTAFMEMLLDSYIEGRSEISMFLTLSGHLMEENHEKFFETMRGIFASIPYSIESKRDEAYFHTVFYLMVSASGADTQSEVLTCDGRIDLVVKLPDKIYIIEFKCGQSAEAAIQQIRDKGYDEKYKPEGKKIILMGINFDSEKRNVSEFIIA